MYIQPDWGLLLRCSSQGCTTSSIAKVNPELAVFPQDVLICKKNNCLKQIEALLFMLHSFKSDLRQSLFL